MQKGFIFSLSECVRERGRSGGRWEVEAGLCYLHDGGSSRHSDSLALGRDACTGARSRQNGGTHTDTRQQHAREKERARARARERYKERKSQRVPNAARKRKKRHKQVVSLSADTHSRDE